LNFGGHEKVARGITVDWFLVRVHTVQQLLAILAVVIVAAVLAFFAYLHFNPAPDVRARRAIEQAEHTRGQIVATEQAEAWQRDIESIDQVLEQAKTAYGEERWGEAQTLAEGATTRFATLLSRAFGDTEGVGHFFSIEGRIQVQRAGKAEWQTAHLRMPVFNGDFVKTNRDGTAEILFVDGSLYRVGPNSLLEIHHQLAAEQPPGTVRMVVGRINVYTADSPSTVTTDVAEAEIRRRSNVAVDVDEQERATKVAAFEGSARVRNLSGDEVVVQNRELVAANRDGKFSDKRKIPAPPRPIDPHNNAGFELAGDRVIRLTWQRPSPENAVHLQVSRSQRFLEDQRDVDAPALRNDAARLKAIAPGTYFWRVATIDDDVMSEWSAVRRFRIFSPDRQSLLQDEIPPPLDVTPAQQMGHLFIVRGQTEPGAIVTINGEFVEVDGEGRFSKTVELGTVGWNRLVVAAVDPSGNRTERTERVYVEGVY
jgi:anaerobic ribonucleoside-triphosphate reductase